MKGLDTFSLEHSAQECSHLPAATVLRLTGIHLDYLRSRTEAELGLVIHILRHIVRWLIKWGWAAVSLLKRYKTINNT